MNSTWVFFMLKTSPRFVNSSLKFWWIRTKTMLRHILHSQGSEIIFARSTVQCLCRDRTPFSQKYKLFYVGPVLLLRILLCVSFVQNVTMKCLIGPKLVDIEYGSMLTSYVRWEDAQINIPWIVRKKQYRRIFCHAR